MAYKQALSSDNELATWRPEGTEVTTHSGQPFSSTQILTELKVKSPEGERALLFFAPPPASIGELRTAFTTLSSDRIPDQQKSRLTAGGIGIIVGVVIGVIVMFAAKMPLFGVLIFAVVCAGIGYACGEDIRRCSYVGSDGVAQFSFKSRSEPVKQDHVFHFENAAQLLVSQTRNYKNGAYTGTTYSYNWYDEAGKQVFVISGSHNSEKTMPPPAHEYYYALSSELAWSNYMLREGLGKVAQGSSIRFNFSGGHVLLGTESIELHKGKVVDTMSREEIGAVQVVQGEVTIARVGAKAGFLGIGRSGMFSFPYSSLANAQLFFFLMERVHGQSVQ